MEHPPNVRAVEEALIAELQAGPSPAAAAAIDRRLTDAFASDAVGVVRDRGWLRRMTVAPGAALLLALALGTAMVAAALVLTAEDQRVVDLTACMRAQGWDVADPNVESGTEHVVPGFSTVVDVSEQDAFNADLEACATQAGIPLER